MQSPLQEQLRTATTSVALGGLAVAYIMPGVERLFRHTAMRCMVATLAVLALGWLVTRRFERDNASLDGVSSWWQEARFWNAIAITLFVIGAASLTIGTVLRRS